LSRTRLAAIAAALYFSEGLPYGIVKEFVHAGYPLYFWITVLLGIPPLLLIPLIRNETSNLHA